MGSGASISKNDSLPSDVPGKSPSCICCEDYILSRGSEVVVPRQDVLEALTVAVESSKVDGPILLVAKSGAGKSTALAQFVSKICSPDDTQLHVLSVYVGSVDRSTIPVFFLRDVVDRLNNIVKSVCGLESFLMDNIESIDDVLVLSNLMYQCADAIQSSGKNRLILIFDALNELDASGLSLTWLPMRLPKGCQYIFSTIDPDSVEPGSPSFAPTRDVFKVLEQRWKFGTENIIHLNPMTRIARETLLQKLATPLIISSETCDLILKKADQSPLFLKLVAHGLKRLPQNADMIDAVKRFPGSVAGFFDFIVLSLEEKIGRKSAEILLGTVWSVAGDILLSQLKKMVSIELTPEAESLLKNLLQKRPLCNGIEKNEFLVNFVHMQARDSVYRRYFFKKPTASSKCHESLVAFFRQTYYDDREKVAIRRARIMMEGFPPTGPLFEDFEWEQALRRLTAHVIYATNVDDIVQQLCNFGFVQAKIQAGQLGDLLYHFKIATAIHKNVKLTDFYDYLKQSAHLFKSRSTGECLINLVLQQALNQPSTSFARKLVETYGEQMSEYIEWHNKPKSKSYQVQSFVSSSYMIWVACISSDGKYIAIGGSDYLIHIFEVESSIEVVQLSGHSDDISHLSFMPNASSQLISVSPIRPWKSGQGNAVYFWSVPDGQRLQKLETKGHCMDVGMSSNGTNVALISKECVFLSKCGVLYKERCKMVELEGRCCSFSANENVCAVGTGRKIRIIDLSRNGDAKIVSLIHNDGSKKDLDNESCDLDVIAMEFFKYQCGASLCEFLIVVSAFDIRIYGKEYAFIHSFRPHQESLMYACCRSLGGGEAELCVCSDDKSVTVWNVQFLSVQKVETKKLCTLRGHQSSIRKAQYHPTDQFLLLTSSDDGTARIFSLSLAIGVADPPCHDFSISACVFCRHKDKLLIISSDAEGYLKAFDDSGMNVLWTRHMQSTNPSMVAITSMAAITPFLDAFAVAMYGVVHVVSCESGELMYSCASFPDWVNDIFFKDGLLIAGGDDSCAKLLAPGEISTGFTVEKTFNMNAKGVSVLSAALSPSIALALIGGNDGMARLFNTETMALTQAISLDSWVVSVSLLEHSSAVQCALAGTKAGIVYLIDAKNGSILFKTKDNSDIGTVAWCSFFQRNYFIVTTSGKRVLLYRYQTDTIELGADQVALFPSLAGFGSPDGIGGGAGLDGRKVVCGDQGGRVYLLEVKLP